nr:PREDICTED: jerky protein homolog-like [Megachile rotundata]
MAGSDNKSRVFLSIIRKMNIAEELEKGLSIKTLSGRYGVSQDRAMGNPINDLLLQEKGNQLLSEIASTSFAGSRGWVKKFKKRYGIKLARAHGEQGSADVESAEDYVTSFVNRWEEEDIDANRIYNMDETGLLWKTVPSKSLVSKCINFVKEAWMNITPNNIKNSWNKILGRDGREGGIEEDENAHELDVSIHSALSDDIHTISGESITYEECQKMLEALNNDENEEEEEEQEEEQEEAKKVDEHEEQNRIYINFLQ